eukprot:Sspe_Gene.36378::Locus_17578_Transcript_1_1_Confidence_1.000_Length_545::g.36378::m.36378
MFRRGVVCLTARKRAPGVPATGHNVVDEDLQPYGSNPIDYTYNPGTEEEIIKAAAKNRVIRVKGAGSAELGITLQDRKWAEENAKRRVEEAERGGLRFRFRRWVYRYVLGQREDLPPL